MQGMIHYNPRLQHQFDHAQAFLASGFTATPKVTGAADVHVISGPWFAYNEWKDHPRTLMIDRAWWGDPDCVSIGWLQPDGTRKFASGDKPRPKPEMRGWKDQERSCLILADYNQDVSDVVFEAKKRFGFVEVREHPANTKRVQPALKAAIVLRDVVICHSGTAGFEAIRLGKPVICSDPQNEIRPVSAGALTDELYRGDRSAWLHEMSYKQWSLAEIASGAAWAHLKDVK